MNRARLRTLPPLLREAYVCSSPLGSVTSSANTCFRQCWTVTNPGDTCFCLLQPVTNPGDTRFRRLQPVAEAGDTCFRRLQPVTHPGATCFQRLQPVANPDDTCFRARSPLTSSENTRPRSAQAAAKSQHTSILHVSPPKLAPNPPRRLIQPPKPAYDTPLLKSITANCGQLAVLIRQLSPPLIPAERAWGRATRAPSDSGGSLRSTPATQFSDLEIARAQQPFLISIMCGGLLGPIIARPRLGLARSSGHWFGRRGGGRCLPAGRAGRRSRPGRCSRRAGPAGGC